MMRHCIVTPDTLGPVKGGGIGTHCYFEACLLARLGHEVTLLLTISVRPSETQRWVDYYAERGVRLWYLQDFPDLPCPTPLGEDLKASLKVWRSLHQEDFDHIHFQDWRAHGFHCIQARRTMGAFPTSRLTVTAHSSTEWIDQGMARWNPKLGEGAKLMWAERYCVQHCDVLVSPSRYMLEWLKNAGWVLPQDCRVIPNPIEPPQSSALAEPYVADTSTIAFFGRLETRKGLELFCKALCLLPNTVKQRIKKILFVGVPGMCGRSTSVKYIGDTLRSFPASVELHTNLDSFEAQALLRRCKCLICIPSLLDNLTYTGIECAVQGMPVLAARTGGIPEVFSEQQLFEPTPEELARALTGAVTSGSFQSAPALYQWNSIKELWRSLAEENPLDRVPQPSAKRHVEAHTVAAEGAPLDSDVPLVSVCMAHFNHGRYLARALDALVAQDWAHFEVIIADDGSTDDDSRHVFAQCRERYDSRFHFFEKANEGPCLTRNFCVSHARGEYLVFVDADNEALPHMLSTMVASMQWSGMDALSCHFWTFSEVDSGPGRAINYYPPLGPDLASGIAENVFGDVNFIVRKDVFEPLGGFAHTRHGCEDWEFLARLALNGFKMDVIPSPLFWYRYTSDGMRSTMSLYHSHHIVFATYKRHLPTFAADGFERLFIPMLCGHGTSNALIIRTMLRLGITLEEKYIRLFPAGSLGQRFLSRVWHFVDSRLSKRRGSR